MNISPETFWQLEMQNQQNRQAQQMAQQKMMADAIGQFAEMYAENKQMEAKASSYDDIGKILGTAMFSENPDAMGALSNLQKEKDPRKKVMGYEQLFSLVGPMSNAMMAQRNAGIRQSSPFVNAGLQGAARVAGGEGTVPLPEEPPLPAMDSTMPPPASQPSPDAMSAANAWYNQSNRGMMQSGSMQPFWRKNP